MNDIKEKMPTIRLLIFVVAAIVIFEIAMLFVMIPSKGAFHWITAGVIVVSFVYLITICLRLWQEFNDILNKK